MVALASVSSVSACPAGAGAVLANNVPSSSSSESEVESQETWITVSCHDRTGLLADVAVTIAKHGLNVLVRPICSRCPGLDPRSGLQKRPALDVLKRA
jgi:ACT domain